MGPQQMAGSGGKGSMPSQPTQEPDVTGVFMEPDTLNPSLDSLNSLGPHRRELKDLICSTSFYFWC